MPNRPVPEESVAITADDLIAVLGQALDGEAQMPTPEDAGFAPNAIRDFLEFVEAHGGFEVPTGRTGNEPVHFGSLMGGLVIGAVAARAAAPALRKQGAEEERQRVREALLSKEATTVMLRSLGERGWYAIAPAHIDMSEAVVSEAVAAAHEALRDSIDVALDTLEDSSG